MKIHRAWMLFAISLTTALSSAQVSFEWSPRFAVPGATGRVKTVMTHDFGSGPQPCIVAESGANKTIVLTLNASGWQPVGPAFEGLVSNLESYDSGSGPELYGSGGLIGSSAALGRVFRWTGTQWVTTGFPDPNYVGAMIVFDFGAGPRLCAYKAGSGGPGGLWTFDGIAWSLIPGSELPPLDTASAFVIFDDGVGPRLFAAGGSEIRKWTGSVWQVIGTTNNDIRSLAVFDDGTGARLHAGGNFTSINGVPVSLVARWSGSSWSALGTGLVPTGASAVAGVARLVPVHGPQPRLYASGAFSTPAGPIAIWNGTSWSAGTSSYATQDVTKVVPALEAITEPGGTTIFAGGNFHQIDGTVAWYVARRAEGAQSWEAVPSGSGANHDATVKATAVFNGELIAGGVIETIGTASAGSIVRWNGTGWQPLGAGLGGSSASIETMAVWDDGSGPAVYAAGAFNAIDGVACTNVAKWNGSVWTPLGSGLASPFQPAVHALLAIPPLFPGAPPFLVAGGNFTLAGGTFVYGLAAWTGSVWVPIANSYINRCQALAVFDDGLGPKLYAGGIYSQLAGPPVSELQRYEPAGWAIPPGWTPGPTNRIWAMRAFDDGTGPALYVSCSDPPHLRKLTGTGVVPVATVTGPPFTFPSIRAMESFDDGDGPALYITGGFTHVNGVAANGIARYRAGMFSPLAEGLRIINPVPGASEAGNGSTLCRHDDGSGPALFAGGNFTRAGSFASNAIAKWGAGNPSLGFTQTGAGAPVLMSCANLQLGREYVNIASVETCGGGPGTGPYLGLCASDPSVLLAQALLPLGAHPFHFIAPGTTIDFGPYALAAGIVAEAICIDVTASLLWRVSPVASLSAQ